MPFSSVTKPVAKLALAISLAMPSQALEIVEQDESGNVNQLNIGVGKTNRQDDDFDIHSNQQIVTKALQLEAYRSIDLKIPASLYYQGEDSPKALLTAPEGILKDIEIKVTGGRLIIQSNGFSSRKGVTIKLYGSNLKDVFLQGAFEAEMTNLNASRIFFRLRGAGELTASGNATKCDLEVDGSHDIDAKKLSCGELSLSTLGANDIHVRATSSISGLVQGASDVVIYGKPKKRVLEASGASDIEYE